MRRVSVLPFVLCACFALAAWPQGKGQNQGGASGNAIGAGPGIETILHSFTCGGSDGCIPTSGVVFGPDGNLYGTTQSGGSHGAGVVFRLTLSGTFTVVHSFNPNNQDGYIPMAGVVFGADGNLYGTTEAGGSSYSGAVYEVNQSGTESVVHNFSGSDGCSPQGGMAADSGDNLYGTTSSCGTDGEGTVFKMNPFLGTFATLYNFTGGADGGSPVGNLVLDNGGNLYGMTNGGGANGFGTVFEVTSSGTEIVLHSFNADGEDGFYPNAGVVLNSKGDLFGTTGRGGTVGVGTVFELTTSGAEKVLYSFKGGADGITPAGSLTIVGDNQGCGLTVYGGTVDLGTVYCGTTTGNGTATESIVHNFSHNGSDGFLPQGSLVFDKSGNLYGTTAYGGSGGCCGTVFKIAPAPPSTITPLLK
jgi:uncharacterized repeat protein (TIGR03803 family)